MATQYEDDRYLEPHRLSDVIRLITALSVDEQSFRTTKGLNESLRDPPNSVEEWFEVAKEHPEFFRSNRDKTHIVLLIRYLQNPNSDDKKPPLTVPETQKLVDQAIALHDKQLARYQRNSFKFPFYGTLTAAAVALLVGFANIILVLNSSNNNAAKLDRIYNEIESTNAYVEELRRTDQKVQTLDTPFN